MGVFPLEQLFYLWIDVDFALSHDSHCGESFLGAVIYITYYSFFRYICANFGSTMLGFALIMGSKAQASTFTS